LKQLQDQAQKVARLHVPSVVAAHVLETDSLIDDGLRGQSEALLLPVGGLVYLRAGDLLHKILRVGAVHRLSERVGGIRHATAEQITLLVRVDELKAICNSVRIEELEAM
jgi:hypothetical protein